MGIAQTGNKSSAPNEAAAALVDRVTISQQVLFRDLGGEAVLLQLDTGQYFGLDDVGTRMWQLLVERGELDAVFRGLLEEFEVEPERLQEDLVKFVHRLAGQGLVIVDA